MITFSIICFLVAAVFGAIVLTSVLKDQPTPKPIVAIHGTIAVIAFLSLGAFILAGNTAPLLLWGIGIFAVAAIGGFTMLTFDINQKPIPKIIAILHPMLAITGVILLVIYALQ